MIDPIVDMLTRIRNAQMVSKKEVVLPHSKIKMAIAEIVKAEGFFEEIEKVGRKKKQIRIVLKYEDGQPYIKGLKRVSKQGQRLYYGADELRPVRGGFGLGIISTSKGLMTVKQARRENVGGEVICHIW